MSFVSGSIQIGEGGWLWPVVGGIVLAVGLVLASYLPAVWPRRLRVTAGLLKAAGFVLLLVCLIEPLWSRTRVAPGENLFLVLVDDSASLQINDEGLARTRGEAMQRVMGDETSDWQVRIAQDFDVRKYRFDSRLASVDRLDGLLFEGDASALNMALTTLADRFSQRPVAGVLLFTDGHPTDWPADGLEQLDGFAPVYPVRLFGDDPGGSDLGIESVAVTQTSFEDAPVTIQADVTATGGGAEQIIGQLIDEEGAIVEEVRETRASGDMSTALRFQLRPDAAGLSFYRVQVTADGAEAADEATLLNNERLVAVDRGAGPFRVLYVSGRPNWEFKFLRRAVEEDDQVELVGLVRVAKKEAKFDFRGRAGESSNPLFRGFDEDRDEETESYDEPVIVRLGTTDEAELRAGFPKTKAELYEYHAIILDDVEAEFFSSDQQSLIERFVSERGGGLLMLGGLSAFRHGGYAGSPIEDLLPVYLDRSPAKPGPGNYRLELTRDGWLQPWVRLRDTELDEERRLSEMPGFYTLSRIRDEKPAARVLAAVTDEAGERAPALVAQQYGDGRTAALLVGDLWRWSLKRSESDEDDLGKCWRQTVRWLVADVPQRIDAGIEEIETGASSASRISVRVRDAEFAAQDNAAVKVTIQAPDAEPLSLDAEPSLDAPGLFETTYVPRTPGAYRAEIVALDETGIEIGRSEIGWTHEPEAEEFRAIGVNNELLERIAEQTGGETIPAAELLEFVESLPTRRAPVTQAVMNPLWHTPWVLLVAIACLAGEWGLRRWRGLP